MCRPHSDGTPGDLRGARLLLVSMAQDLHAIGPRTLATVLEAQGAEVWVAHLPASGDTRSHWVDVLVEIARDMHLVGFSLLSVDVPRATTLTRQIKRRTDTPIVWGGPWPTLRPGDTPPEVDFVCRGDGETFLRDLLAARLSGRSFSAPEGLAPMEAHLDAAPRVGLDRTIILRAGRLEEASVSAFREKMATSPASRDTGTIAYETVTSRGCPHACAFCATTALAGLQGVRLRLRPLDSVFDELAEARRAFPFVSGVGFDDDNLLARPVDEIAAFSTRYKREVGLPFICIASPATVTRDRLGPLVDAGLRRLKLGLQSGSPGTARKLGREALNARVPAALEVIAAFQPRLLPTRYDLLVDLPFEELPDRLDTLGMVSRLPRPYRVELNSLRLMAGTPLFDTARQEGWSTPDNTVDFKRIEPGFTNLLLALSREGRLPGTVLATLARGAPFWSQGLPEQILRQAWLSARAMRKRLR